MHPFRSARLSAWFWTVWIQLVAVLLLSALLPHPEGRVALAAHMPEGESTSKIVSSFKSLFSPLSGARKAKVSAEHDLKLPDGLPIKRLQPPDSNLFNSKIPTALAWSSQLVKAAEAQPNPTHETREKVLQQVAQFFAPAAVTMLDKFDPQAPMTVQDLLKRLQAFYANPQAQADETTRETVAELHLQWFYNRHWVQQLRDVVDYCKPEDRCPSVWGALRLIYERWAPVLEAGSLFSKIQEDGRLGELQEDATPFVPGSEFHTMLKLMHQYSSSGSTRPPRPGKKGSGRSSLGASWAWTSLTGAKRTSKQDKAAPATKDFRMPFTADDIEAVAAKIRAQLSGETSGRTESFPSSRYSPRPSLTAERATSFRAPLDNASLNRAMVDDAVARSQSAPRASRMSRVTRAISPRVRRGSSRSGAPEPSPRRNVVDLASVPDPGLGLAPDVAEAAYRQRLNVPAAAIRSTGGGRDTAPLRMRPDGTRANVRPASYDAGSYSAQSTPVWTPGPRLGSPAPTSSPQYARVWTSIHNARSSSPQFNSARTSELYQRPISPQFAPQSRAKLDGRADQYTAVGDHASYHSGQTAYGSRSSSALPRSGGTAASTGSWTTASMSGQAASGPAKPLKTRTAAEVGRLCGSHDC